MEDKLIKSRLKAINYDGAQIVQTYLKIEDGMVKEEFVKLVIEAYHCFINGCPRASILMSGETLLRVILYQINTLKSQIKISRYESNQLTSKHFATAIGVLKKNKVYPTEVIKMMEIIKELRNIAVHGEFPVLFDWDPDDGRSEVELMNLYNGLTEIPEGYKFDLKLGKKKINVTFDLRKYNCNSLKKIDILDKYAVIQFSLFINIISCIFNNTDNVVIFPNR